MTGKQRKMLIRIIVTAVIFALLFIIELYVDISNRYFRFALYAIPYLIISYDILKKAVKGIFRGQVFDENFLMAVASVGAIAIGIYDNGSYEEAVAVMLFYQIGELFQSYAVGKSRKNIAGLMDIRPDYANLFKDGKIVRVSPDEVETGSVIVVSAGEKIPIDGIVVDGQTSLDTSALTGESIPKNISVNDEVISGCINLSGTVRIRTTKAFGESTVSRILDLVENSSSKKSKSEKFISRFARYYTPAVCIGALILALFPPLVSLGIGNSADWPKWIYRALTFLVISCPCALVISIPLSFFAGIGGASKCGILVKGSNYLETLSKTKIVVFDKTGTMTKGVFDVVQLNAESGFSDEELLEYSAHCECYSSHPISKSLIRAYGREIDKSLVSEVREISGNGVIAKVKSDVVAAGNIKLMKSLDIDCVECKTLGTVVYVAVNGVFSGSVVISDTLKENSVAAVEALRQCGVKKTVMLTGDRKQAAQNIASQLDVDEVYSELLPENKVEQVEELLSQKNSKDKLAFVGDGINDAPVLSRADIGIAMGALGSDAAIEAADVVLMDDDPLKISKALKISRKCLRIVYENIGIALGIKAICLVLGAIGVANMWLAIFADVGVMLIAVINAIRALSVKRL